MAFWRKWRRETPRCEAAEPWEELNVSQEEIVASGSMNPSGDSGSFAKNTLPVIDAKIFSALAGRCSPLEADAAVSAVIEMGWDPIAAEVRSMALGRRAVLPSCFQQILAAYPQEAATALWDVRDAIPWPLRLCFYATAQCDREAGIEDLLIHWDELPKEGISQAFRLLGMAKTPAALEKLGVLLEDQDWTIVIKAAVALEAAGAVEYLPKMRAIADASDNVLKSSISEIIHRMEK